MKDKNGIKLQAGDIVEIKNAYFKNDKLFLVCRAGRIKQGVSFRRFRASAKKDRQDRQDQHSEI